MANKYSQNDRQEAIYELQHSLRFLSKHIPEIPTLTPDGVFGEETENAVRAFQRLYTLPETGEVDKDTWYMILDAYLDTLEDKSPGEAVSILPPELSAMKPGDRYDEVLLLQVMLKKLADRYKNLSEVVLTGIYDGETENAVKTLQKLFGLPQTGSVDRKTWNRISRLFSAFTYND